MGRLRSVADHLALPGEAMDLFETSAGYSAFEDAKVLLCIDVEGLIVYVLEFERAL
jgi:hypothetical protein